MSANDVHAYKSNGQRAIELVFIRLVSRCCLRLLKGGMTVFDHGIIYTGSGRGYLGKAERTNGQFLSFMRDEV